MKKLVIFTLCLFTQFIFSNDLFNIKIEKNQKIQGTFSAELSENSTLHFVFTKNSDTKKFEIIPVFVDSNKQPKQLDMFETTEMPSILSYHKNGSTVTLSNFYEKKKELQRIDFDVNTGKFQSTTTKDFSNPKNIFRLSNQTVFVDFDKTKNKLSTTSFSNSKEMKEDKFEFSPTEFDNFKSFFGETPEEVNQNEFVKNGPISKRKSYLADNKLIFTSEKDKSNIEVLTLHLDGSKKYKFTDFDFNYPKEIKDQNTFVADNMLLSVAVSKEDVVLNSFDMTTKKATKSISLQNDFKLRLSAENREKFIQSAAKNAMKPTVTVNKTKDPNKLLVVLDRVDKNKYYYNHNWWHFHWMMMQQQQMMHMQMQMMRQQHQMMQQSIPRGFGPNMDYYDALAMMYTDKSDLKPIQFVIDTQLNLDESSWAETIHKPIERDNYLEKFKDDKSYKEFTAGFTATDFRYIYFDKKADMVYLKIENL